MFRILRNYSLKTLTVTEFFFITVRTANTCDRQFHKKRRREKPQLFPLLSVCGTVQSVMVQTTLIIGH